VRFNTLAVTGTAALVRPLTATPDLIGPGGNTHPDSPAQNSHGPATAPRMIRGTVESPISVAPAHVAHALRNTIGPGILLAGAAIGVSHLVQSTRAGADYGFALFWALALACISKYPCLEFGPRYAAATGHHLVHGYRRLGAGPYWLYVAITVGTMFIIQAAVTLVTAGLAEHLFGLGWTSTIWSMVVLASCIVLLVVGRYPALDMTMKVIITVLAVCTLAAVAIALAGGAASHAIAATPPTYWTVAGVAFIIAFMGWMPIPIDASVWHSIWSRERARQTGHRPTLAQAKFDYDLGYIAAAVIGVLFFLLGALVMFGGGRTFPPGSVAFSAQLIDMYGQTLGAWSAPLVAVAAFTTMFSTTLAVTDAYPRVAVEVLEVYRGEPMTKAARRRCYAITILIVPAVAVAILAYVSGVFTRLVDFAAGLSFISAPILGWFNLRLVTSAHMPEDARPAPGYLAFSRACLAVLVALAAVYLYWKFIFGV